MKKKLMEMLAKKNKRKQEIMGKVDTCDNVEELRAFNEELDTLNKEIRDLEEMLANTPDETPATPDSSAQNERTATVNGQVPGIVTTNAQGQEQRGGKPTADPFSTMEYRMAFMEFCKTGKLSDEFRNIQPEYRLDAMTTAADVTAIIPSTILREIIKEAKIYGRIFSRIRTLNIKGGVTVPILGLKPVATRIGESTPSSKQKVQVNTNVTFNYYGLECKVSTSLLAGTVTLDGFETLVKELIGEAMIKATEAEIISGTGNNQCLGITQDTRVPSANKVTLSADEISDWSSWKKKVFAQMPLAYKAGAAFLMASGTWEGYIDGMVDANGQPVGRMNYGITDGTQERFGGKEVILVEDDLIAPYDDADSDEVIAIYCDLRNYAINSNLQMMMFRYFDHDTNEWVDKAILINDGKLLDPHGVVIVSKA